MHVLTITGWFSSTPHSIGLTSPGHITSHCQHVSSDTGVGSHGAHWSSVHSLRIIGYHSIGWNGRVRAGGYCKKT